MGRGLVVCREGEGSRGIKTDRRCFVCVDPTFFSL